MAYNYYQQNYPGWGRSGFQLGPPPLPNFQPEPAWSGYDYYRAHAINPSRSLFHSVLDRVRGYDGSRYVSTHEARSIHLRLYGGFLSLDRVMPDEIGSAAAYEAYRTWKHHGGTIFSPLGGHSEREREALVGLALAEASHLWHYAGRSADNYGLQDALEVAALTASRLYEKRTGKIISDVGGMAANPASVYARDYAYTRPRRYSSSVPGVVRSGSPYVGGGAILPGPASVGGTPLTASVGLPGSSPLSYDTPLRGSPYAGGGVQLPPTGGMYGPSLQPTTVPLQAGGMVMPQQPMTTGYGVGYGQQQPVIIQQQQPYPYSTGYAGYGGQYGGRYGASGYGGAYGGYAGSGQPGMYGSSQPVGYSRSSQPIIIDASGRSGRHHHHHSRSRSVEPRYESRRHHRHDSYY